MPHGSASVYKWDTGPGGGEDSAYERGGDARRLAYGVNVGFWSHLGCKTPSYLRTRKI